MVDIAWFEWPVLLIIIDFVFENNCAHRAIGFGFTNIKSARHKQNAKLLLY